MKSALVQSLGRLLLDAALKHAQEAGDTDLQALILKDGEAFLALAVSQLADNELEREKRWNATELAELAGRVAVQFQGMPLEVIAGQSVALADLIIAQAHTRVGLLKLADTRPVAETSPEPLPAPAATPEATPQPATTDAPPSVNDAAILS